MGRHRRTSRRHHRSSRPHGLTFGPPPSFVAPASRRLLAVEFDFDFVAAVPRSGTGIFAVRLLCVLSAPISAHSAFNLSAFLFARLHQCRYQCSSGFISGDFGFLTLSTALSLFPCLCGQPPFRALTTPNPRKIHYTYRTKIQELPDRAPTQSHRSNHRR